MVRWAVSLPLTNRFEEVFSTRILEVLNSNFLASLSEELVSRQCSSLLSEDGEEIRFGLCVESDFFWIFVLANEKNDEAKRLFRKRARFYIKARCAGHSSNYVYSAIQELSQTNFSLPIGFPVRLKSEYWIPSKWVQRLSAPWIVNSNAITGNRVVSYDSAWVVVDGQFAWIYDIFGSETRCDAREFEPKFKTQFEAARKEAQLNLQRKGISQIDSNAIFHEELQTVLKSRFGINWITPEELKMFE